MIRKLINKYKAAQAKEKEDREALAKAREQLAKELFEDKELLKKIAEKPSLFTHNVVK